MPPVRKVDLLPAELRAWLQEALKARGFGGYEELAEELNGKLEEAGYELRIGKTALHEFGSDFREYAQLQETAQDEMRAFLKEMDAKQEVDVTSVLFQQLSAIAFKTQMAIAQSASGIVDPRGLKELTTALNNLIRSTALRDGIRADFEKEAGAKLEKAVEAGNYDKEAAQKAREIMGFA